MQPETDTKQRCWRCGRLLFMAAARPWVIYCPKCKALNQSPETA